MFYLLRDHVNMFTDLALSRELTTEYRDKRGGDAKLTLMILQRSCWPFTVRNKDVVLPVWVGPCQCTRIDSAN